MSPTIRVLFILTIMATLAACQRDDEALPPSQPPQGMDVAAFSELSPGNYWIYQKYKVDSTDQVLETLFVDSIFVTGDTILNGETFAVIRRSMDGAPPGLPYFWRDSADCLITSDHRVLFCADPLDQVIYTLDQGPVGVLLDFSVSSIPESVTVPAGTFSTYCMRSEITSIGGFPEQPDWKQLRSNWAAEIGRIRYYEFYYLFPFGYRYDLIRYHIGP